MMELARSTGWPCSRSNEMTCRDGQIDQRAESGAGTRITRHGVLVEVYGEGITILGDSGIGKE